MAKNFLWITNTEDNVRFYSDSAQKSNLSLHFAHGIDPEAKKSICGFIRYLRKEFFFPIRCNVYFCDREKFRSAKGGYCYGIFFSNDQSNGRTYPQIYVPAKIELYSVCHSLCHELTHYFQWYFFLDREKDCRSLEIQASRYANRIVEDYAHEYGAFTASSCKTLKDITAIP